MRRQLTAVVVALLVLGPACTSSKKDKAAPTTGAATGAASTTPSPTPTPYPKTPEELAARYLELWQAGELSQLALLTDADAAAVQTTHDETAKGLNAASTTLTAGAVEVTGVAATAPFTAKYVLPGLGEFSHDGSLPLVEASDNRWVVTWTPAVVHPLLKEGQRLARTRSLPRRGDILDAAGRPLFARTETITVGIEPRRIKDPDATYAALTAVITADVAALKAKVAKARPDEFVPIVSMSRAAFTPLRPRLNPIPGVVFQTTGDLSPPTPTFARALLGRVGEASAEVLEAAGDAYQAGDRLGLFGLQSAFQERLSGTPSGAVQIKLGNTTIEQLQEFKGKPAQAIRTTIDRRIQSAAEAALGQPKGPAAMVVIRPSTGAILAAANRPDDNRLNRAFTGQYPPGSTMKAVTTAALLRAGVKVTDSVPCPPTVRVSGKTFRNFEGEAAGPQAFSKDFAHSCNTAFISLNGRLKDNDLGAVAAGFGLGGDWKLPMPAYTGSVPAPKDQTELAASMIGQGRVLASPLGMASVAAAVANGTWRSPVLVTNPLSDDEQQVRPLDPRLAATLRGLMRQVVAEGTGKNAAAPGPPVSGKTGTAEFGTATPLQTHAWFIGYRGDLAVAVLLEGGGVGGRDAAPIAGKFFTLVK